MGIFLDFNLIITHEPGRDNYYWALSQVREILGPDISVIYSRQSLIFIKVQKPHEAAQKIRESLRGSATPIYRVIPIDAVVDPLIDSVRSVVENLAKKIPKDKTFRITLQGHLYGLDESRRFVRLHTVDSIKILADKIDRRVDLSNPDWIVFIKVVVIRNREFAAIAVLENKEMENIQKTKL